MEFINISHCILYTMKLAGLAEGKKIRRWFIPLLALIIVSLFLSGSASASNIYLLNNTFYDPNYETNPGVFEELISPWQFKKSDSTQNSYVSLTALILYPNEGIQRPIHKTQIPSEFNFTSRMYFFSWPTTDSDISPMWQLCSSEWNTGSAGYVISSFELNAVYSNGTYLFKYNDYSTYHRIYVPNGASNVYTLTVHTLFNTTGYTGVSDFSFCYELSSSEPGDETYVNDTGCMWRYGIGGYDTVYLRLGGYSAGAYSTPGYTWVKFAKMWWDDGVIPPGDIPPDESVVISNLVHQIVFFIPILVLTSFFGRIGFIGGVGLMSVIWMFTDTAFIGPGIMIFIALGILVYKGGMD